MDLHTTCKEYDFCTPETRAELAANGFDFSVCKFGITEFIAGRMQTGFIVETNGAIPHPTFTEVWRLLPKKVFKKNSKPWDNIVPLGFKEYEPMVRYINENNEIGYKYDTRGGLPHHNLTKIDFNICEAACLLWLELKKGGFLNGR